jgi:hypothetical protein
MILMLTIIASVLVMAGVCLRVLRPRIIAWCLFVLFSILAKAWGFASVVSYPKPFTGLEITVLWIITAAFVFLRFGPLLWHFELNKKRDNEVA